MATFEKSIVSEYGSLERFARADGCYRIYESDRNYHVVRKPADEAGILTSSYIANPRVVWESFDAPPRLHLPTHTQTTTISNKCDRCGAELKGDPMCCPECGHDDKGCLFMLLLAAGACIVLSPFAVYGAFAFWGHATTGNPVADFSNSYDFIFGCPITTFYVLAGVVSFPFVIRIYCRQIRWKWRNHKENVMPKIGILFDVDAFNGGLYGYAAYKVFFAAIDTRQLAGCLLSDGDTQATLLGQANHYCIAVTAPNPAMISVVKNALWESHAEGLLSPTARFMDSALVDKEPLVVSARIGADGRLLDCTTGWVIAAWKECQPYSSSVADESSPKAQNKKHWWQFWKA